MSRKLLIGRATQDEHFQALRALHRLNAILNALEEEIDESRRAGLFTLYNLVAREAFVCPSEFEKELERDARDWVLYSLADYLEAVHT